MQTTFEAKSRLNKAAKFVFAATAATAFMIAASPPVSAADCPEGLNQRMVVDLLFGRNIGAKIGVSEQAFRHFVDREVTPRFPDGFTVIDSYGQYRDTKQGQIIREPGKLIVIALGDEQADLFKIRSLVTAYKERFRQQSVGIISRRACVAF